jgi:putative sugar O-methyltransferase
MEDWVAMNSSIGYNYLNSCAVAASNNIFFETFKSHPHYVPILEHVGEAGGKKHYDMIKQNNPKLLIDYPNVWSNDSVGSPNVVTIEGRQVSPTTLRYLNVLSELMNCFGSLDGLKIVEIGGGYGGQRKIIYDVFSVEDYTIIDLPEVSILQSRYLREFDLESKTIFYNNKNYKQGIQYDLVISNYALSEVNNPAQYEYVEDILLDAKRGYLTCNVLPNTDGFSKDNLKLLYDFCDNVTVYGGGDLEGGPTTNSIITWGT